MGDKLGAQDHAFRITQGAKNTQYLPSSNGDMKGIVERLKAIALVDCSLDGLRDFNGLTAGILDCFSTSLQACSLELGNYRQC